MTMNGRGGYTWFVASCDRQGSIRNLLVDQLGLCPGCRGGLCMTDVLDTASHKDWLEMMDSFTGFAADAPEPKREWTLSVRRNGHPMKLQFSAARDGDGLIVAGRGDTPPHYFGSAAGQNGNGRTELLNRVSRQLITESEAFEQQQYLDEISRLNNELVNAHRELARSHVQLEKLNEHKNELLGMAAHDIRNPLGNIRNLTLYVLDKMRRAEGGHDEVSIDFLQNVVQQSDQLLFLLEDVLDLSSVESGKLALHREDICLNQVVAQRVDIYSAFAGEKDQRVELAVKKECVPCYADLSKVAQVCDNVLSNAVKYSHNGGRIDVEVDSDDSTCWLLVRDYGVGMSQKDLDLLCTPFARLSSRPTGGESSTGLGMALVKQIVEGHGGKVEVRSEIGKGTTVTVRLPVHGREC